MSVQWVGGPCTPFQELCALSASKAWANISHRKRKRTQGLLLTCNNHQSALNTNANAITTTTYSIAPFEWCANLQGLLGGHYEWVVGSEVFHQRCKGSSKQLPGLLHPLGFPNSASAAYESLMHTPGTRCSTKGARDRRSYSPASLMHTARSCRVNRPSIRQSGNSSE